MGSPKRILISHFYSGVFSHPNGCHAAAAVSRGLQHICSLSCPLLCPLRWVFGALTPEMPRGGMAPCKDLQCNRGSYSHDPGLGKIHFGGSLCSDSGGVERTSQFHFQQFPADTETASGQPPGGTKTRQTKSSNAISLIL